MDHEGPQNKIIQIDEALVKRELGGGSTGNRRGNAQ
jgi:hypothetical protein